MFCVWGGGGGGGAKREKERERKKERGKERQREREKCVRMKPFKMLPSRLQLSPVFDTGGQLVTMATPVSYKQGVCHFYQPILERCTPFEWIKMCSRGKIGLFPAFLSLRETREREREREKERERERKRERERERESRLYNYNCELHVVKQCKNNRATICYKLNFNETTITTYNNSVH